MLQTKEWSIVLDELTSRACFPIGDKWEWDQVNTGGIGQRWVAFGRANIKDDEGNEIIGEPVLVNVVVTDGTIIVELYKLVGRLGVKG